MDNLSNASSSTTLFKKKCTKFACSVASNHESFGSKSKSKSSEESSQREADLIDDHLNVESSQNQLNDLEFTAFGIENLLNLEHPIDEIDTLPQPDEAEIAQNITCLSNVSLSFLDQTSDQMLFQESTSDVLTLLKCSGHNRKIPIVSLSDGQVKSIFFVCSHVAIICDYTNETQILLQGHANAISCTAVSEDRQWIVTGDKGENSLVNIWNGRKRQKIPIRTFFNYGDFGVAALAFTSNSKYLAILSFSTQFLDIWDWTIPKTTPLVSLQKAMDHIPLGVQDLNYENQNFLNFNAFNMYQLVSNSENQVIFFSWSENSLNMDAPVLTDTDFHKQVGKFSQTMFLKNKTSAISATSLGNFVVWENYTPSRIDDSKENMVFKRAIKIIQMQDKSINTLASIKSYIVTGDSAGQIKFYDQTLKLINWFQDYNLGSILSISFDSTIGNYIESDISDDQCFMKSLGNSDYFQVQDFVFSTSTAMHVLVTDNGTKLKVLNKDFDSPVFSIAVHPDKPLLVVGSNGGMLQLSQYKLGKVLLTTQLESNKFIQCLTYTPDGNLLAMGLNNGCIGIINGLNLQVFCKELVLNVNYGITDIVFSDDMQYMAASDSSYAMTLFIIAKQKDWFVNPNIFTLVGRLRVHSKPIRTIMFDSNQNNNSNQKLNLFSLSEDRLMVEYGISPNKKILLHTNATRIEQKAIPTGMASYSISSNNSQPINYIITNNDEYKFKFLDPNIKICVKTVLGPTFGSPIQKFLIYQTQPFMEQVATAATKNNKKYLLFMMDDKIGVMLMPMDGNHHRSSGIIAHPSGVKNIAISHDGRYVFSVGGKDGTVMIWGISLIALEVQEQLGGKDLEPFYEQIEGGVNGTFLYELENLFYCAQIRSQGINTMDTRKVGDSIPPSEIPNIMRALGFFPSENQIEDMIRELGYLNLANKKKIDYDVDIQEVSLQQFIKMYINHRPALGLKRNEITSAFAILCKDNYGYVNKEDLFTLLQTEGEKMHEDEITECFTWLMGFNIDTRGCQKPLTQIRLEEMVEKFLPDKINDEIFIDKCL